MSEGHAGIRSALAPTRPVAFVRRIATPIWFRVGIVATLEVPGRRTGATLRVSLIPIHVDGRWYLMAFGGTTDWALNLRAAGLGELRHKGRTQAFRAVEVDGNERERAIAAYLAKAGPITKDFNRRPAPADHPTFRVDPV